MLDVVSSNCFERNLKDDLTLPTDKSTGGVKNSTKRKGNPPGGDWLMLGTKTN